MKKILNNKILYLFILLFCTCNMLNAEDIYIKSNNLVHNYNTGISTFLDNVVINYKNFMLKTDKIIVHKSDKQIKKILIPQKLIIMEKLNDNKYFITCNHAQYIYNKKYLILLKEDVIVNYNNNVFITNKIKYYK